MLLPNAGGGRSSAPGNRVASYRLVLQVLDGARGDTSGHHRHARGGAAQGLEQRDRVSRRHPPALVCQHRRAGRCARRYRERCRALVLPGEALALLAIRAARSHGDRSIRKDASLCRDATGRCLRRSRHPATQMFVAPSHPPSRGSKSSCRSQRNSSNRPLQQ